MNTMDFNLNNTSTYFDHLTESYDKDRNQHIMVRLNNMHQ